MIKQQNKNKTPIDSTIQQNSLNFIKWNKINQQKSTKQNFLQNSNEKKSTK